MVTVPELSRAVTVFSDNFSSGNFESWSETILSPGSSQTISNGVARFTVPSPSTAGNCTYSYIKKDGFTSTPNSTIIASQDIYFSKVPSGLPEGNTAIFFFYICDSTDMSGNRGNFGVGIDGSDVWSLWIGGNPTYTYVVQTAGSAPASNTWYHLDLTVDNAVGAVSLAVNGVVTINVSQRQFTDRIHAVSLMTGMGEDWWVQGSGQQEIDVDNVVLYISDASSQPLPADTPTPNATSLPGADNTQTPTATPTKTPKPTSATSPSPFASPQPTPGQLRSPDSSAAEASPIQFLVFSALTMVGAVVLCVAAVGFMLHKKRRMPKVDCFCEK